MRIRRLWIENFRGIEALDWTIPMEQRLFALVGPGDSGKSTILDAVHLVLGDRWNVPFSDTDFFGADVTRRVLIRALIVDVPRPLMKDTAFGLWLSGVDEDGGPHQDPTDAFVPALIVTLAVDATLEPRWAVVRVDGSEQVLTSSQRRAFSTFMVDDRTDAQLRWSRNSPLGRMSSLEGGERDALAAASRAAREALSMHENSSLADLAANVQDRVNQIGGGSFAAIRPGLDTSRSSMGAALALYEDVVPLTGYGLGSRRLASLAVQQLAAGSRSVALVDELESGLEPHRAVRLLNYLKSDDGYSQVFVTTHSPVIVEQTQVDNLAVVQNRSGAVSVTCLGGSDELMQRLRRSRPSSLLARRVVVVEGKTEYGVLLECLDAWDRERASQGLSTAAGEGVAIQDGGGGTEIGPRTEALARLGFAVIGFLDNDDRGADASVEAAERAGLRIVRWESGFNTEAQLCAGLTAPGLTEFVALGVERRNGQDTVRQDLDWADPTNQTVSFDVQDWLDEGVTLDNARDRIVRAAVGRKWFKDAEGGRVLGRWITENSPSAELAATWERLDEIRSFVYDGGQRAVGDDSPSKESDG